MRIDVPFAIIACAGSLLAAALQPAAALPASGIGRAVDAAEAGVVEKAEFRRRPDGSVYYVRPRFDGAGPYFFAYRGYAYPYYPGYTYRLYRGELQPHDRPHRYKIVR